MLEHVWIIPALMALSFVLILAIGKRTPGKGHFIGIGFVAIAFVLSIVTGAQWISRSNDTAHSQAAALRWAQRRAVVQVVAPSREAVVAAPAAGMAMLTREKCVAMLGRPGVNGHRTGVSRSVVLTVSVLNPL